MSFVFDGGINLSKTLSIDHINNNTFTSAIDVEIVANNINDQSAFHADIRGVDLGKTTTQVMNGFQINMDQSNSTANATMNCLFVSRTNSGEGKMNGFFISPGIDPIYHLASSNGTTVQNAGSVLTFNGSFTDITSAAGDSSNNATIFATDGDLLYVGFGQKFSTIEVILNTKAGDSIFPEFEYSLGSSDWETFGPSDNTHGFKQTGSITWLPSNLLDWSTDTVNGASGLYWIRIQRDNSDFDTAPIEETIKIIEGSDASIYRWDAHGNVNVNYIQSNVGISYENETKGDILVSDGNSLQLLNVGTNDLVLKANSATSSGVEWGQVTGGSGETNTGSSVGESGVGTFITKVGADLRFRNIAADANNTVLVSDGGTANTIVVSVIESGLDLNNFGGAPLSVPNGGTGATTLGSGNVLIGAGTSAVTTSKAAPSGDFVGTTDTQTLTNKTIVSSTNNVAAGYLFANVGNIVIDIVNAAEPSSGQVLTATSNNIANWQTPSSSGETNTGSNVGESGVGTFVTKVGTDLRFRNITADANNTIEIVDGGTANTIVVSVVESGLDLNNFGGTPLSVSSGGTGVATLGSGNVLVGAGTGAVTTTKAAPTGDFVGTTDTQTLTNKTISAASNTVGANEVRTTGASVVVDTASPPTTGQVLTATSATAANWQTPSGGSTPRAKYQIESIQIDGTTTSNVEAAYFAWDQSEYSTYSNGVVRLWAEIADRNLSVYLYDNTGSASLGGIATISATGISTFTITEPSVDSSLVVLVRKSANGGTNPEIRGISIDFDQ